MDFLRHHQNWFFNFGLIRIGLFLRALKLPNKQIVRQYADSVPEDFLFADTFTTSRPEPPKMIVSLIPTASIFSNLTITAVNSGPLAVFNYLFVCFTYSRNYLTNFICQVVFTVRYANRRLCLLFCKPQSKKHMRRLVFTRSAG